MQKVSVVILNWNGVNLLKQFLPSVIRYSQEAQIVVADNGSTDNTLEILSTEFPQVRIIALNQNYGFAEGYNKTIQQIETEYSILLNSDVEVTEGWLKPLIEFMDNNPQTVATQPKILSYLNKTQFEYAGACGGYLDKLGYPFCRGRIMETIEEDKGQYDNPIKIFWATGAALMIRTNIYKETGGLDSRFFAHQEEIDFCWRLRSRGYDIYCIPQSIVYHVGGATLQKSNPRKTFLNFRNNLLMLYKNLPSDKLFWVMLVRYFLDYIAVIQQLLSGHHHDALAIIRARFEFSHIKHQFDESRQQNIKATKTKNIAEQYPSCLLWNYYALRHHTWAQQNPTKND